MTTYKIKWKSYIADLYIPEQGITKIAVLVPGLPKSSNIEKIVSILLASGCAVIYPNFSGTFDSGGVFDPLLSIGDVKEFIEWAHQSEVVELYFNKKIELGYGKSVVLVGMSFGAVVSLLACNDRVNKLILLSPAILFKQDDVNKIVDFNFKDQMDSLASFLINAFPFTYRVSSPESLKQFLHGQLDILSRSSIENALDSVKIVTLVIHGKLDSSIPWQISNKLRKSVNNPLIEWNFPKVAHSTSSYSTKTLNMIRNFISAQ